MKTWTKTLFAWVLGAALAGAAAADTLELRDGRVLQVNTWWDAGDTAV